jgi:Regulator of chromosome condensation (RCC1) repeat
MSCAVTSAGAAKCWGANDLGQLGDGTTTPRLTPVGVSGLTSGAAAIATVKDHTCVLTIAGGMKCWGLNINGELGDGTTTQRLTPVDVSGLTSGVAAMAVGFEHTCALTTAGGMKCWGLLNDGQLGDGTRIPRSTPVDVFGLPAGVAAIAPRAAARCGRFSGRPCLPCGRIQRVRAWMWQRTPPRANAKCPPCDRPVVVGPAHACIGRQIMFAPWTMEELIAACPLQVTRPSTNMTRAVEGGSAYLPVSLGICR